MWRWGRDASGVTLKKPATSVSRSGDADTAFGTLKKGGGPFRVYRSIANNTVLNAGIEYGIIRIIMKTARKITVEIPSELIEEAQRASETGITQTVRTGLQLIAASHTYARL